MTDLGTLGGNYSAATAVNGRCQVAGVSQTADGTHHAFLWSDDEGMRDLGTLGGGYSYADDVNERGQVVGWSRTGDGRPHAALWNPE
jgi:probable HAF family extracellular repeat protein